MAARTTPAPTRRKRTTQSQAPKPAVFCPVCPHWQIKHAERCGNTLKRAGATLYFCTQRCKERYIKNPASFA